MVEADAIIFGAPVYLGDVPGKMRCFIERTGFIALNNKTEFKRKIGAIIIAKRKARRQSNSCSRINRNPPSGGFLYFYHLRMRYFTRCKHSPIPTHQTKSTSSPTEMESNISGVVSRT